MSSQKLTAWSFTHYFKITDPALVLEGAWPAAARELTPA